jgi:hypothetical protein
MNPKTDVNAIACAPGTLSGGPVRTRFFDGMFLTQADLENEQRTWRLKRRLTNRALGTGVVWGLRLAWNAARRTFVLSPGYALDCCGNDLVVECPVELGERELWTRADPGLRSTAIQPASQKLGGTVSGDAGSYRRFDDNRALLDACIVLQYSECAEDARAVHRDACAGPTGSCEPSRIRESARLLLVPPPSAPPPTPPELFLEELAKFRDSLPAAIRDQLFPPQTGAPPTSALLAPVQLTVTLPGSPVRSVALDVPASGTASAPGMPISTTETPSAGRRSGVVTFMLTPSTQWSFTAGRVLDQGRVVETVTPPMAPSMYWALDVALPDGVQNSAVDFDFELSDLTLSQAFGGTQHGRVRAHITGTAAVTASPAAGQVVVELRKLEISTQLAEVVDQPGQAGCLRELVPWGWTVDPANGDRIAKTLVLGSLYAFLSEVVSRGGSPQWQLIARVIYAFAWLALFGVNPMGTDDEKYRLALAELIVKLYQRWCDGFAYPGPRCSDEHHGIYLGCATIDRSGAIQSFDMWEHRRYVLTGPLLAHWGNQLGIAPIDVIVGRFVRATCCLAGMPAIALPAFLGKGGLSSDGNPGSDSTGAVHVGTPASAADYAIARGAAAPRWVSPATLTGRVAEAFTAQAANRPVDVLATQIDGGGVIAIAVPAEAAQPRTRIRDDVRALLRRGDQRTRERGRAAVADFTDAVMTRAPVTALIGPDTSEAARQVAEAAAKRASTVADLVEDGTDALAVRAGMAGDAKMAEGAAELVDLAEQAVDRVTAATVKALGPNLERASFADPKSQDRLVEALAGGPIPGLSPSTIKAAAAAAAGGG